MKKRPNRKALRIGIIILITIFILIKIIPPIKFHDPYSTIIESEDGYLMGAKIAKDGQWRFPEIQEIPSKYYESVVLFEDKYFKFHPGINPFSLLRATFLNIKNKKIISGGSTITMQVARLWRKGKPRTIKEKCIEIFISFWLEVKYSKKEIIKLYASHAPFGGNTIGLETATWRYFNRSPEQLSWAEAATLAVLPNAPSLIYPGKNSNQLLEKRNRLLQQLLQNNKIDSTTYDLSISESLPDPPQNIPQIAPHIMSALDEKHSGQKLKTTLNYNLQLQVKEKTERHYNTSLKFNHINNACALVINNKNNCVLSYVGNIKVEGNTNNGNDVDIIQSPRSTGSILKPILFAAMLMDGQITPYSLIPDIPITIDGFSPKNFNLDYNGAVPACEALQQSLNIPAVLMLKNYNAGRFLELLRKAGITTMPFNADHYGLSLILGGAEGSLWEISSIYSAMARTLSNYPEDINYFQKPKILVSEEIKKEDNNKSIISASAIWSTFKALLEVNRPVNETGWQNFQSSDKVAWKTGTSFGFRDGWAIGTSPEYTVGVWVGNADGEGRPGLTGLNAAAPLLFDIFDLLNNKEWFQEPYDELAEIPVCKESGYRAGNLCTEIDTILAPESCLKSKVCNYHILTHLDTNKEFRVTSNCENPENMKHLSWFILPPTQEYFFKKKNPMYKPLPPFRRDCITPLIDEPMEFIYPNESTRFYIPRSFSGKKEKIIFELVHREPHLIVFWHLDNVYIGSTQDFHQMEIQPDKGTHEIICVDELGNTISKTIEITDQKD